MPLQKINKERYCIGEGFIFPNGDFIKEESSHLLTAYYNQHTHKNFTHVLFIKRRTGVTIGCNIDIYRYNAEDKY